MFENEDSILPEGFEESVDQPESNEDTILPEGDEQEQIESEESGAQEEATLTEEQQEQLLKLKYNGEEKEIPLSEATILAQKGLNYDKLQTRLQEFESDPRLSFVDQLAKENGFDNPNDFLAEFQAMQEQAKLDELIQSNIPPELAEEILENRKHREQLQQEKQQAEEKAQQDAEFMDFFDAFKNVNGRDFNGESDQIPQEVWDLQAQGMSLKDAYNQHQVIELQKQIKILKQNESNKGKAPVGSLSAHGSHTNESEDDFLAGFNSYE